MTVSPSERHRRSSPCPVCGGFDGQARGKGLRCAGYTSEDGKWTICTRIPEGSHHSVETATGEAWAHLLRDEPLARSNGAFTVNGGRANGHPVAAPGHVVAVKPRALRQVERELQVVENRSEAAMTADEYETDRDEYDRLWAEIEALKSGVIEKVAPPKQPWEDPSLTTLRAQDMLREPLPIEWVCERLRFTSGPVSMVAGEPGSGKTYGMQALGVSVASGQSLFGAWSVKRGKFRHFDYEQGPRLTHARYREIGLGMGIDWAAMPPDDLVVEVMPTVYMATDADIDTWCRLLEGYTLCLIDSFRRCCRVKDENAPEAARPLEAFWRVSEKTGCTVAMTHHFNKAATTGPKRSLMDRVAGSAAIVAMCQDIWAVERDADIVDSPSRWIHGRSRFPGSREDGFELRGSWAPITNALTFRLAELEQAKQNARREAMEATRNALWLLIRDNPGMSGRSLAKLAGRSKSAVADDLAELDNQDRVASYPGPRNGKLWRSR